MNQDNKPALSLKVVREIVTKMEMTYTKGAPLRMDKSVVKVNKIKKGDIFLGFSINGKERPYVVAKVVGDMVLAIALTTTPDMYALIPYTSRFFRDGYICNSFTKVRLDFVTSKFVGIMENTRVLNKAIKLITEQTLKDLQ